jgi:hypothetical protein
MEMVYVKILFAFLLASLIFVGPIAKAEGLSYTPNGLSGAELVAYEFFRKRGAYYLVSHKQERAGDTYVMPDLRPVLPIEKCYKNVSIPLPLNQGLPPANTESQEIKLNVFLKSEWIWSADVNIVLTIKPHIGIELSQHSRAEIDNSYIDRNHWNLVNCPWLSDLNDRHLYDGIHLPIYGVIYVKGRFTASFELTVNAFAEIEATKISDVVSELKKQLEDTPFAAFIPDLKLKAAVSGGYAEVKLNTIDFNETTPAAFIPKILNTAAMDRYIDIVGYNGEYIEKYREFALRSPRDAASFINDFPNLRMDTLDKDFTPPLLRGGDVEAYEPRNIKHKTAIQAELFFIHVNVLANLQKNRI